MQETESLVQNNNFILIGMPGVGKSTVGVILAKVLNYAFIDSDLVIQNETGKKLSELISEYGIDGFNAIENRINASITASKSIIATGGSVIYGQEAMEHFKEIGTIIYLSASYDDLVERLGDLDERGVVHRPDQTLMDLYHERSCLYEKYADITIIEKSGTFSIESTVAAILDKIR